MEFIEIVYLLIIGVFSLTGLMILYQKVFKSKQKRTTRTVQDTNIDTIVGSYEGTIEILKQQLQLVTSESLSVKRRLAKEIGLNYERNDDVPEKEIKINDKNLDQHYEIDLNAALPLVKSLKSTIPFLKNMNDSEIPNLINNPIAKKFAWDYIKKNKDEMISLGVIVPIGQTAPEQIEEKQEGTREKETDVGMMNLNFDENNRKYMA